MITGRITGGSHGWPFAAATFDLAASGYVEEEWRLDGQAQLYEHRAGTGRSFDGRWSAEPAGTVAFATRLLVRRPRDADHFNGTVVLFWNNVSLGFDLLAGESPEIYDGGFCGIRNATPPSTCPTTVPRTTSSVRQPQQLHAIDRADRPIRWRVCRCNT
ncbi:MAG: hypothetical protein E6G39_11175 [Actinobacteria bacterium]|nr:MAG: hypothetical protein E6G39_11175 [Actinomycetota bacterium]